MQQPVILTSLAVSTYVLKSNSSSIWGAAWAFSLSKYFDIFAVPILYMLIYQDLNELSKQWVHITFIYFYKKLNFYTAFGDFKELGVGSVAFLFSVHSSPFEREIKIVPMVSAILMGGVWIWLLPRPEHIRLSHEILRGVKTARFSANCRFITRLFRFNMIIKYFASLLHAHNNIHTSCMCEFIKTRRYVPLAAA